MMHSNVCCALIVFCLDYEICCPTVLMKVPCIADIKAGDSKEDAEARSLLNKFLGAQVILQGMEPLVKASQSHSAALVSQVERQRVLTSQKVSLQLISVSYLITVQRSDGFKNTGMQKLCINYASLHTHYPAGLMSR